MCIFFSKYLHNEYLIKEENKTNMEKDVDELKERQENEVEALKSIFDHNFKDCRHGDVWQVRRPPEFEILILPENSTQGYSQAYVSVTLKFKFTSSYPRVKPDHSIANNEGLSKGQVDELQSKLESRSDQLEGNEMVYELCVEASQYLAPNPSTVVSPTCIHPKQIRK